MMEGLINRFIINKDFGLLKGLIAMLLAAFSLLSFPNGCNTKGKHRPNIILISVDTLRPDHLGCYGYEKETSPNLDRFAKEGVIFRHCFSHAPETGPSCTSLLSGFLPHETGVEDNLSRVPKGVPMIAEVLRDNGYNTYAVVSNFILKKGRGYAQGFQIYDDKMDEEELNRPGIMESIAEKTADRAISILKGHKDGNFFIWIHYQDPHGPYTPKGIYTKKFMDDNRIVLPLRFNNSVSGRGGIPDYQRLGDNNDYNFYLSRYDGEIGYFDEHFGRMIEFLKDYGMYEDSIIIFTADHGEALGEHGFYFCHSENLTNSLIHVPLIIRYKGIKPGVRSDYVQHIDLAPTVLKLAGCNTAQPYRGRDILKRIEKKSAIFSKMYGDNASIIVDGIKLIISGKDIFLYDIRKDILEADNLALGSENRLLLDDLKMQLLKISEEDMLNLAVPAKLRELTEEEKERFKSLGYVDHGE